MPYNDDYVPFSQRNGYADLPPQLKVGEISNELRSLLSYTVSKDIRSNTRGGPYPYLHDRWKTIAEEFHVYFLREDHRHFENDPREISENINQLLERAPLQFVFDMVEFFVRHERASETLIDDISDDLIRARSAYRLVDGQVIAIGEAEQGEAVERALTEAEAHGARAARSHLVQAGAALKNGDWAGSVRESIHAVESIAREITDTGTLGPALNTMAQAGHIHPALRGAFSQLYGYTSDEEGVRHAKVFEDKPNVDETDALFMLGACASFVSYLIARRPE